MTIYIFVTGGQVDEVLGTDDYEIIDYDDLESGRCPICGGDNEPIVKCTRCGFDFEGVHTNREVMEMHRRYRRSHHEPGRGT